MEHAGILRGVDARRTSVLDAQKLNGLGAEVAGRRADRRAGPRRADRNQRSIPVRVARVADLYVDRICAADQHCRGAGETGRYLRASARDDVQRGQHGHRSADGIAHPQIVVAECGATKVECRKESRGIGRPVILGRDRRSTQYKLRGRLAGKLGPRDLNGRATGIAGLAEIGVEHAEADGSRSDRERRACGGVGPIRENVVDAGTGDGDDNALVFLEGSNCRVVRQAAAGHGAKTGIQLGRGR